MITIYISIFIAKAFFDLSALPHLQIVNVNILSLARSLTHSDLPGDWTTVSCQVIHVFDTSSFKHHNC